MLRKPIEWPDTSDPEAYFRREGRPLVKAAKTVAREDIRRRVFVQRKKQQGLTAYEAHEQFDMGLW